MEKRSRKRLAKRLQVRFGPDEPDMLGFTDDLSEIGIFIKTSRVVPPGTKLKIQVTFPDGGVVNLTGEVVWGKMVPPSMARFIKKNGFGVRLLNPPRTYLEFVNQLKE
jgi:hypothetical protein